jgi:hypothetical protein
MGIAYTSIARLGLIVEVWDGVVTIDDWRTHVDAYLADPERLTGRRSLVDLSTADASAISDADEAEIVAKYIPHASELTHRQSAAVAAQEFTPSVEFGRRIQRLGLNVIIFNELTVACTFLGIDPSEVQPVIRELRANLRNETNA